MWGYADGPSADSFDGAMRAMAYEPTTRAWRVLGDSAGLGLGWAALIVAGVWAVIAAVLALVGRRNVQRVRGMPRTVETTKEIPDALRGRDNP